MSMTKQVPNKNIDKLPRWAQDEITSLRRAVVDLEAELAARAGDVPNAKIVHSPYHHALALKNEDIHFRLSSGTIGVSLRTELGETFLDVNSTDGVLNVFPRASNVVYMRVK